MELIVRAVPFITLGPTDSLPQPSYLQIPKNEPKLRQDPILLPWAHLASAFSRRATARLETLPRKCGQCIQLDQLRYDAALLRRVMSIAMTRILGRPGFSKKGRVGSALCRRNKVDGSVYAPGWFLVCVG